MRVRSYNIEFTDVVVFAVGRFWFASFKMRGNILAMIFVTVEKQTKESNKNINRHCRADL